MGSSVIVHLCILGKHIFHFSCRMLKSFISQPAVSGPLHHFARVRWIVVRNLVNLRILELGNKVVEGVYSLSVFWLLLWSWVSICCGNKAFSLHYQAILFTPSRHRQLEWTINQACILYKLEFIYYHQKNQQKDTLMKHMSSTTPGHCFDDCTTPLQKRDR